jgi:hypothetical protein
VEQHHAMHTVLALKALQMSAAQWDGKFKVESAAAELNTP